MSVFDYMTVSLLILFYVVFAGKTVKLRLSGVKPFVLGKEKRGLKAFLELLLFPGLIVWTLEVLTHSLRLGFHVFTRKGYPLLVDSVFSRATGMVLIITGFLFFISALYRFGPSWRMGIDKKSAGSLVTGGVFSLTRNPIFLFMDLYFIGTFLVYGNLFFLAAACCAVIAMHVQILQEETFLRSRYGDDYLRYQKHVPRYLSFTRILRGVSPQ